ncbi:GNAT family N-acetyltransferase [Streptantibioticus ferralitis]|uniref:GNAT family N-acetyltransferase n=1 Tax=Streptantibioticus ferralitis TaxID=236510 RepID=A0ABT5Z631_9ACTN|nr:GNAT family N-acetyltransferase [Streptantibioticus ferralitis]MDF2259265.1 GNAT family N-acetyltransferase [Streptantibioticus ferralitis]
MTTTLRPAGAEQRGADGGRSRRFTVCVNSRPVGVIQLATDERFGPEAGRIVSLDIDEKDRRRGRGTVAALAAEEVLRGWGCRWVETRVPADAAIALRLASALGYVERNRGMIKSLPDTPPELPGDAEVRPMGEADYDVWHERGRARYIDSWVQRGVPYEQAAAKADADHRRLLGDGPHTADAVLRILAHGGQDVGWLWLGLRDRTQPDTPAWVFDVEVAPSRRGQGHGRTLMLLAERECLARGIRTLGLNVFAGNTAALRLYESLGYRATELCLAKPLL